MFNHFAKNRGPVFSGSVDGSSAAQAQSTLAAPSSGSSPVDPDMQAMFNQGMEQQKQMYEITFQQGLQKDALQTEGDASQKTIKSVQMS